MIDISKKRNLAYSHLCLCEYTLLECDASGHRTFVINDVVADIFYSNRFIYRASIASVDFTTFLDITFSVCAPEKFIEIATFSCELLYFIAGKSNSTMCPH